MSSSPGRRARRRFARQAPPRLCGICRADMSKMPDLDAHVARHVERMYGTPRAIGRRLAQEADGVRSPILTRSASR